MAWKGRGRWSIDYRQHCLIPVAVLEGLAGGHNAVFPLPEHGWCPGVVPSLALSQQSPEQKAPAAPHMESTVATGGKHRRDRSWGDYSDLTQWEFLPEQQLSNHFACWHTPDTPLRFIWELSRFLISLHLSWLYFDKTALDKSIFFFLLLCLIAPMMHLGNIWGSSSLLQPEHSFGVLKCKSLQALGVLQGWRQGKPSSAAGLQHGQGLFHQAQAGFHPPSPVPQGAVTDSRVQRCDLVLSLLKAVGQLGFVGQGKPLNTLWALISALPTGRHSPPRAQVTKNLSVQLSVQLSSTAHGLTDTLSLLGFNASPQSESLGRNPKAAVSLIWLCSKILRLPDLLPTTHPDTGLTHDDSSPQLNFLAKALQLLQAHT